MRPVQSMSRDELEEYVAALRAQLAARDAAERTGREMLEWLEKEALPQMGEYGTVSIGKPTVRAIGKLRAALAERDAMIGDLRADNVKLRGFLDRLQHNRTENESLRAQIAALREALRPFAKAHEAGWRSSQDIAHETAARVYSATGPGEESR